MVQNNEDRNKAHCVRKKQKITNIQHRVKKNNNCLNLLKHKSTENWWQIAELKQGKLTSPRVLRTFSLSKSSWRDQKKNIFLHLTTKLSIYYLSYSIYTQEPFDIVNLSSMQDTYHMWTKRWPSAALCPCGWGVENQRAEYEDLRFSFSWGLRTFPFS